MVWSVEAAPLLSLLELLREIGMGTGSSLQHLIGDHEP